MPKQQMPEKQIPEIKRQNWRSQTGSTLTQYSVVVAVVAIVAMIGVAGTGDKVGSLFCQLAKNNHELEGGAGYIYGLAPGTSSTANWSHGQCNTLTADTGFED